MKVSPRGKKRKRKKKKEEKKKKKESKRVLEKTAPRAISKHQRKRPPACSPHVIPLFLPPRLQAGPYSPRQLRIHTHYLPPALIASRCHPTPIKVHSAWKEALTKQVGPAGGYQRTTAVLSQPCSCAACLFLHP